MPGLLQLTRKIISPIIERNVSESQYGFRKNCGTSNAIHLLRTIGERMIQKNKTLFLCFIDYEKAFDRVQHNKFMDMMESIGIPFHERRLIKNIYWNQTAVIKVIDEISEKIM